MKVRGAQTSPFGKGGSKRDLRAAIPTGRRRNRISRHWLRDSDSVYSLGSDVHPAEDSLRLLPL
jgi:hypothetical protein